MDPQSHPLLSTFLKFVVGFDTRTQERRIPPEIGKQYDHARLFPSERLVASYRMLIFNLAELTIYSTVLPFPDQWSPGTPSGVDGSKNPPFVYCLFYIYSNLQTLNAARTQRGLSMFIPFRMRSLLTSIRCIWFTAVLLSEGWSCALNGVLSLGEQCLERCCSL